MMVCLFGSLATRKLRTSKLRRSHKLDVLPLEDRLAPAISLAAGALSYSQNFNALSSGSLASLPGWLSNQTALATSTAPYSGSLGAAQTTLTTNTGNSNAGAFVAWTAGSDIALGDLGSGSHGGSVYGVNFQNNTGSPLGSVTIQLTYEMYRRGSNATPDQISFSYRVGGNDDLAPVPTAYTQVTSLYSSFTSAAIGSAPNAAGPGTVGNVAASNIKDTRSATISFAMPIAVGQIVSFRWDDPNNPGTDDGIGIDDLSIVFPSTQSPPVITSNASTTFTIGTFNTFQVTAVSSPTSTISYVGTLPSGVTLSPTGILSGTPAAGSAGSYSLTITASNGVVPNATQAFTLTVGQGTMGKLRIANYNIASADGAPRDGLATILQSIGAEAVAGTSRPIDILALQEVNTQATTTQAVVDLLNGIYGANTYARGTLNGNSTGAGTQGIVFRTSTVSLLGEYAFGTIGTTGSGLPSRQPIRYKFHINGAPASSDFYIYNSHYKAGDEGPDMAQRFAEAQIIRADADALGEGTSILYVGDFNAYSSSEQFFQTLISAGNGRGVDPVNQLGDWHANSAFLLYFTQSPVVAADGLTGGGLDDRFDFITVTDEVMDGAGFDYIPGSYRTFGNNGSVIMNRAINHPSSTALPSLANRLTVLNSLASVSDHLPVVADFQYVIPAADLVATTTTVTGTPQATTGGSLIQFTARVQATPTPNAGTVIFLSGGTPISGAIPVVNGQALFSTSSLVSPGNFSITANYSGHAGSGFAASTSSPFIATIVPPPSLVSTVLNGATPELLNLPTEFANQRSMVRSFQLTFDAPVSLASAAVTISIHPNPLVANPTLPGIVNIRNSTGGTGIDSVWNVTFGGLTGGNVFGGSIGDGQYDLNIVVSQITDAFGQHPASAPAPITFYRLFGDADGNRTVNNSEIVAIRKEAGTTQVSPDYRWLFDSDWNSTINTSDITLLRRNAGKTI
jgi:endonuclease/exonuclease/phosphatase family metal-dependent hydrolase